MLTSKELLARYSNDGLTMRHLREFEVRGILHKIEGGRGRGNVFVYQEINHRAFRVLLRDIRAGQSLEQASARWRLEANPSVLVASAEPFLFSAVKAELFTTHRVHWAIHGNVARQYMEQEELHIQALLCQDSLPDWAFQQASPSVAGALIDAARGKGWFVRRFGSAAVPGRGPAPLDLEFPFAIKAFVDPLLEHFKLIATLPNAEGGAARV